MTAVHARLSRPSPQTVAKPDAPPFRSRQRNAQKQGSPFPSRGV
jgi:hypothetical protein